MSRRECRLPGTHTMVKSETLKLEKWPLTSISVPALTSAHACMSTHSHMAQSFVVWGAALAYTIAY